MEGVMPKYLSPLVSCVVCKAVKSTKGIFSHFNLTHTEDKQRPTEQGRTAKSKKISTYRKLQLLKKIQFYNNSPNICACGQPKQYNQRNNKYCGSSCAATFTNRNRVFIKSRKKHIVQPKPVCLIQYRECEYCYLMFVSSSHKGNKNRRLCSKVCLRRKRQELGSISAKERNFGGVSQSKKIFYNGVWLGSSYEVILAKSLDEYGIKWVIPKKIKYIDHNKKEHSYTADFYLPVYDVYLDPKNDFLIKNINPTLGFRDADKIKWVSEQNNVKIIILSKEQLSWDIVLKLVGDGNYDIPTSTV